MEILVLGVNHRTAPAKVREELFLGPDELGTFYAYLKEHRDLLPETAVLSTCNRTEIYALAREWEAADHTLREAVYLHKGVTHLNNGKYTYSWTGRDAVQQLFRVAAGVDSLMVGEPQILGQVREALDLAEKHRTVGALLTRLFHTAIHVGKRARAETEIGKGTVSVAFAAVELTQKIFDRLDRCAVLVVGAGDTGALAARHFAETGPGALVVVNRTYDKAQELAAELGGRARPWEELEEALAEAQVVVTATAAPEPIVDVPRMERVLKRSPRGPKVLVDISNPRNIHPGVGTLERVFLYDLDALQSIAEQNRARRLREIPKVEGIVAEETDRFMAWFESLDTVPVIRALRGRFEAIAEEEMRRQAKRFHPSDREALEAYTRALLNKLLHQPTTRIRNAATTSKRGLDKLVAIQELFELDVEAYKDRNGGGVEGGEGETRRVEGEGPA